LAEWEGGFPTGR